MIIFLETSRSSSNGGCEDPIVPSIDLKTLILDSFLSMFRTFTFSDPILRISFSLIFGYVRSPETLKYVTNPVDVDDSTPWISSPDPTKNKTLFFTFALYVPSILVVVVDIPEIVIISWFSNSCGFGVYNTYSPRIDDGYISTSPILLVATLILFTCFPPTIETLADTLFPEILLSSNEIESPIW